ncbi:unnamed protein product [Caenorhabditis sp. 36 PRJEB53466]|nr:unnamed protein product [Caenorhabditis sp. 36 PRJEB53466]
MILLTYLLLPLVFATNFIQIQYFRKPVEYGRFRVSLDGGAKEWESFIYMNKTVNLREEEIYKIIKPFFESEPSVRRYESASITRHLGQQFEYILNRYPVDTLIFENLCSQMKRKFSSIIRTTTQKPKNIKWIVEHPSAAFTIPDGFRNEMGRDEYQLEVGGRALLNQENFEFDALINTNRLIVRQTKEYKNGLSSDKLIQLKGPEVYIEGQNHANSEDLKKFAKEWLNGEREVKQWEIHLEDDTQNEHWYFEKDDITLDVSVHNGRLFAMTYKTPADRPYQFTVL